MQQSNNKTNNRHNPNKIDIASASSLFEFLSIQSTHQQKSIAKFKIVAAMRSKAKQS
jgi:hypothetical protein